MYEPRFYRNFSPTRTVAFQVTQGESDLFIRADQDLTQAAKNALSTARWQLENYIRDHPLFLRSLVPLPADSSAPPLVRNMLAAGAASGVGPMAAVAGAIAQQVGGELAGQTTQIIVENGGDIYLWLREPLSIGIYAGNSALSGKIGLCFEPAQTPCGLCTSSGTVGHSYSEGVADAAIVYALDAALADAAATAIGNAVQGKADIPAALIIAQRIPGVRGACLIVQDQLGIWGELRLQKIA